MKVTFRFRHSKDSKDAFHSPATFHFDPDASTGPVIQRGEFHEVTMNVKAGDLVEYSTTKFSDESEFKVYRDGRLINGEPDYASFAKKPRGRK